LVSSPGSPGRRKVRRSGSDQRQSLGKGRFGPSGRSRHPPRRAGGWDTPAKESRPIPAAPDWSVLPVIAGRLGVVRRARPRERPAPATRRAAAGPAAVPRSPLTASAVRAGRAAVAASAARRGRPAPSVNCSAWSAPRRGKSVRTRSPSAPVALAWISSVTVCAARACRHSRSGPPCRTRGLGGRTQQTPSTEQVLVRGQQTSPAAQGWPQISQVSMVGDSGAQ